MHPTPELSRIVVVSDLRGDVTERTVAATREECDALAVRLGIPAVREVRATLEIRRLSEDEIRVAGPVTADVVQSCVVSLVPVEERIEETLDLVFSPHADAVDPPADIDIDSLDDTICAQLEGPEPLIDGRIDIGDLVAETVALALDPYPRAPGAQMRYAPARDDPDAPPHPFAKLSVLMPGGDD